MPIDTVNVTGTFNLPDDSWTLYSKAEFVLSGVDTDGEVVLDFDRRSVNLTSDGGLDIDLWPNERGQRGTVYQVYIVRYATDEYAKETGRVHVGVIQISGDNASEDIADLLSQVVTVPGAWYSTITEAEYNAAIDAADRAEAAASEAASALVAADFDDLERFVTGTPGAGETQVVLGDVIGLADPRYEVVESGGISGLTTPMVLRVGLDGVIYAGQVGAKPGSAHDATSALQLAIDDLSDRAHGGVLQIPSDEYFVSSLRIMPRVKIKGSGTQVFAEGVFPGGSRLRQIAGTNAPLIYNDPDTSGGYVRNTGTEGAQYYYNSSIEDMVLDSRSSGNTDTRADCLRLERLWNFNIDRSVFLAGRRSFAWRLLDCNVLWGDMCTTMGPSFFYHVADSMFTRNQWGGLGGNASQGHFFPTIWLADPACWKNLFTGNMPFNNTANLGGQTYTFTASGDLLTLDRDHFFNDRDPVSFETDGTLPSPLTTARVYFVTRVNSTQIRLSTLLANVGNTYVSLSGGSGTHVVRGGADCNMFLQQASRNSFVGQRYDQAFGSGIVFRGATLNAVIGGTVMENGLGSGGTVAGMRLENGSSNNAIKGLILDGNATQTQGIVEDATCTGNVIDVTSRNHSSGDLVLNGTRPFAAASFFLGTDRFEATAGSPSIGLIGGFRRNAWLMDASTNETIQTEFIVPPEWRQARISVYAVNAGAGSGDYRLGFNFGTFGSGENLNVADPQGEMVARIYTALAQDILNVSVFPETLTVTAGEIAFLRIIRGASDAADTLANDIGILGVLVERTL